MTTTNMGVNKHSNKPKATPSLWLAIRLTHFSLECLGVKRTHHNIMVSHKSRICGATNNLYENGVALDMPVSTAQLLHQNDDATPYRTYEREIDSERKALDQLCDQLYNLTPHIEPYHVKTGEACEEIGVLLELSRCLKLFKGLIPIVEKIRELLDTHELSYSLGQGHSKYAAWLLSYSEENIQLKTTRHDAIQQLKNLDLGYLHEYPDAVVQLKKAGFFSFGDLIRHIEKEGLQSFRKRFSLEFNEYLSELLVIDSDFHQTSLFQKPVISYHPKQHFIESIQFEYPISNCEQLQHPVKTLLHYLTEELIRTQTQTQAVCWHLYDIYQNQEQLPIYFERLHRDSQLAEELTMIQLENQPLPFEVDVLELRCEKIFPVNFNHTNLYNDKHHQNDQHAFATITAKLNARLGEHAVYTLTARDSHIPELSYRKTPAKIQALTKDKETIEISKIDRPGWIFNVPVPIGKRQNTLFWKGKLELLQGPERIEGLWWKKPTGRDYFIAKRDDDVRLWVFHDLYKDEWFVHGVFA